VDCRLPFLPGGLVSHLKTKHNHRLSSKDVQELEDLVQLSRISRMKKDTVDALPPFPPPSIEGVNVVLDGVACHLCEYAAQFMTTLNKYYQKGNTSRDAPNKIPACV